VTKRKLALLMALALALRLLGLTTQSLWSDEGVTFFDVLSPNFTELLRRLSTDTHPPLYYCMLHCWVKLLPWTQFALGSLWLRLPSALAGTATLLALAHLLRRMELTSLIPLTLMLLAVSAFHIQYSQEARSHIFTGLLAVAATDCQWQWLHGQGRRWALGWWSWTLLGLYFNPFFGFFWLASIGFAACARSRMVGRWGGWWLGQTLLAAAFTPFVITRMHRLAPAGFHGFASTASPGWRDLLRLLQDLIICHNFPNPQLSLQQNGWLSFVFGLLALGLGIVGATRMAQSGQPEAAAWLVVWWLGPIVICEVLTAIFELDLINFKYFLVSLPAFLALLSAGLRSLPRVLAATTTILLIGLNLTSWSYRNFDPRFSNQDWRSVGATLARLARPGDVVVVQPEMMVFVLEYYYNNQCPIIAVNEAFQLEGNAQLAAAPRVWTVTVPAYRTTEQTHIGDRESQRLQLQQTFRSEKYFNSEALQLSLFTR
jgi:mannosyltransferase